MVSSSFAWIWIGVFVPPSLRCSKRHNTLLVDLLMDDAKNCSVLAHLIANGFDNPRDLFCWSMIPVGPER